ncbi:MAG: DUF4760 domain-containing protein [Shimia sp.]
MTGSGEISRIDIAELTLIAVGVIVAGWQLIRGNRELAFLRRAQEDANDWNRRTATLAALDHVHFAHHAGVLRAGLPAPKAGKYTETALVTAFAEDPALRTALNTALNEMDALARGWKAGVFDLSVLADARKHSVLNIVGTYSAYIHFRRRHHNPEAWSALLALYTQWTTEGTP